LAAIAVAFVLAGCNAAPAATPPDGVDPVMVRGMVVDSTGTPISTQYVQISILDPAHSQQGQPIPLVYDGRFGVGIDGRFEARIPITPQIDAFAAANDHVVNFNVLAVGTDGSVIAYGFPRTITQGQWAGDVPFLTLRPGGGSKLDEHPSQP
jgi:hypothetical protein